MYIARFEEIKGFDNNSAIVEAMNTEWFMPIETIDMKPFEMARRTKFENNDTIRYLTQDNRDILYRLVKN